MSRLTDEELDEAFEYAHGSLRLTAALAELKERRAADLSDEEREALIDAQRCIRFHCNKNDKHHVAALAVLSKILSHAGGDK